MIEASPVARRGAARVLAFAVLVVIAVAAILTWSQRSAMALAAAGADVSEPSPGQFPVPGDGASRVIAPPTTATGPATFAYDVQSIALVEVCATDGAVAGRKQPGDLSEWSALPSAEPEGASTTPSLSLNATEAGYTASKINITEDGLNHVFDRHLADGSLSAGKSLFNDNVTITRLIADADAVLPGVQGNGNLAYVVDAGRAIGVDRVTGQATSIYTVITKPGGDLVTAFPGTP